MSKEYIERDEVIERIRRVYCLDCESMKRYGDACCDSCGIGDALNIIDDQPAADVVEVAHGRWMHEETEDGFHIWRCSRCGRDMNSNPEGVLLYCYHCGAKMDEFLGSISTLAPA